MKKRNVRMALFSCFVTALLTVPASTVMAEEATVISQTESGHGMGYVSSEYELEGKSIYSPEEALIKASNFPVYFKTEKLPTIKDQGAYGTCWAFSTLSLLEINMMKQGYAEDDFSEMHLAYYAYNNALDRMGGLLGDEKNCVSGDYCLNTGGNYNMASNTLKTWKGAAEEELLPYNDNSASMVANKTVPASYAFQDVALMKNFYMIDMSKPEEIKQAIMDYGAVGISYYADGSFSSTTICWNPTTAAYYCPYSLGTNHAVTVVGWDDNYSKHNFSTIPNCDGAWIVRNSWGSDYGQSGYFYLSYADKSIGSSGMATEAIPASAYDYNYQYDGANYSTYISDSTNNAVIKGANIFTVKGSANGAEYLHSASFETYDVNYKYTVTVYKNLTDLAHPESGVAVATAEGITSYVGNYTIDFAKPVYMKSGETFSVVVEVKSTNGGKASLGVEYPISDTYDYSDAGAESGQSFFCVDGEWVDFGAGKDRNVRIKAYTTDISKSGIPAPTPGYTGLAQAADGNWYFFWKGYADPTYNGLAMLGNDWWMVVDGKIDFGYNGLVFFNNDWWYIAGGRVDSTYNGLAFVNENWWYVVNGKIDFNYNGLAYVNNAWWYVTQGRIDFTYNGLTFYNNEWWYLEGGCVNFNYNGLAFVNNAWWYVVGGRIDFSYCGLFFFNEEWWYVQGGCIDFTYNNLYFFNDTWWYVENGKINFSYNGLAYVNDAWWYVQGGVIDFGYSGLASYDGSLWYVDGARVDFTYTGMYFYNNNWLYIVNGKFLPDYNGTAVGPDGKTYCFDNGVMVAEYESNMTAYGRYKGIVWIIYDGEYLCLYGTADENIDWTVTPWIEQKNAITSASVNVSGVTSLDRIFKDYTNIKAIDFSGMDTSNVTDMSYMFVNCSALETVNLSGFDTSKVTDMMSMFSYCSKLETLDLSNFNTESLTCVYYMFSYASELTEILVGPDWDLTGVGTHYMFYCCGTDHVTIKGEEPEPTVAPTAEPTAEPTAVPTAEPTAEPTVAPTAEPTAAPTPIPTPFVEYNGQDGGVSWTITNEGHLTLTGECVSEQDFVSSTWRRQYADKIKSASVNVSGVVSLKNMFKDCEYLTSVDFNSMDTSNVTNMSYMFYGCESLTTVDVSGFDTANVTDMSYMFNECSSLTELDVNGFDTTKVRNMDAMFAGCRNLSQLDVSGFNTQNVTSMYRMFYGCSLTELDVNGFNTTNVTNMKEMFRACSHLVKLDVSEIDTSNVIYMSGMFAGCSSLTELNITGFDTANVQHMSKMFSSCSNLTTLDLSGFDTANVLLMDNMFSSCSMLTTLDLSGFNTSNVTNMEYMFSSCSNLITLDVSKFNTTNVTSMYSMFMGCSGLSSLDLSSFATDSSVVLTYMFCDCSNLTEIWVGSDWILSNEGYRMFYNCGTDHVSIKDVDVGPTAMP